MRRVRALGLGLLLALPWLGPALSAAPGGTACATGRPHAALVVDTGARTTTYCVGLDATTVSGLHLVQLAAAQYGLSYRLGFGGQAVCQLDGVGSNGGNCFGGYPDFWGYWHGDGQGGWSWAGSGAGSASIGDGAIDAWSWGQGDSGTTHPSPPHQRFEDVCAVATPTPTPTPKPTPAPSPRSTPSPSSARGGGGSTTGGGTPVATPSSPHEGTSPRPKVSQGPRATPAASPTDEIVRAQATGGRVPSSGGPPAGALVALGAVALLGAGGWRALRRRRTEGGS